MFCLLSWSSDSGRGEDSSRKLLEEIAVVSLGVLRFVGGQLPLKLRVKVA